jgi:hypothetical protein
MFLRVLGALALLAFVAFRARSQAAIGQGLA